MKKGLLVAALSLTIATSVISGTLAAYNQKIDDLIEDTISAKKFVVTAEKVEADYSTKLAPGEEQNIEFTITNYEGSDITETDMEVVITIDITDIEAITPLEYTLSKNGDNSVSVKPVGNKIIYSYNLLATGVQQSNTFNLNVNWPFDEYNNGDLKYQGQTGPKIKITVEGVQIKPVNGN